MEGLTRRALAGLAVLGGTTAASAAAGAATVPDSLDALAKAKGFIGFGSEMDGATSDVAQSFNDAGVLAIQTREYASTRVRRAMSRFFLPALHITSRAMSFGRRHRPEFRS